MAVTVETLEKLERKIKLTLPVGAIENEVQARLKKISRTVKMDGFRPGKVPINVVAKRYGYSVQYDVMNEKVGEAFSVAASEAKIRVAGQPKITESENSAEGDLSFDAVFEVYPEVKIGDLSAAEVVRVNAEVDEAAVDKTIDVLRKQRRTFSQRPHEALAQDGDRATVDFEGKIDGEAFEGGKAESFQFILGDGQMLKEFEDATRGMKINESKTFQLSFPIDYHGKDVAGKSADFMVTVKKLEAAHLPEINDDLAKVLGITDATVSGLRDDVQKNLEREIKFRLLARNKAAAMEALLSVSELDLPQAIVQSEIARLIESAREDLKKRGVKDADKAPIPEEIFMAQAERRVRLGLVVADLVKVETLQATVEQIKAHVEELASSYEKPEEVQRWYFGDKNRLAEVEGIVIENNVTQFILAKAKVSDKKITFNELMEQN